MVWEVSVCEYGTLESATRDPMQVLTNFQMGWARECLCEDRQGAQTVRWGQTWGKAMGGGVESLVRQKDSLDEQIASLLS